MTTPSQSNQKPDLEKLFKESVKAYKSRDYHQARELLKLIVEDDPFFEGDGRRASDLLADVEIQLAEKSSSRRKNRILGFFTILLGVTTAFLLIFLIITSTNSSNLKTSLAAANGTMAAQTNLLHSSAMTVTAAGIKAESAQATMITMRQSPGSAQATIQAYEALSSAGNLSNQPIYGPASGQLLHLDSDYVISEAAGVNLKNMVIEARFYNPFSASENSFDYGFFFRDTGGDQQYRLVVDSDSTWIFDFVEDPTWNQVDSGNLPNLDTSAGGSNLIRLVVLEDRVSFYVNGVFIASLPADGKLVAGDVFIVTASYEGHEIIGRSTDYENFTIWPLP